MPLLPAPVVERTLPPMRVGGRVLCPTCHYPGTLDRDTRSTFYCLNDKCGEWLEGNCRLCGGRRRVGGDGLFVCEYGRTIHDREDERSCPRWREIVRFCPTCGSIGSRHPRVASSNQWCWNSECPDAHSPTLMSNELNSVPMILGTESEAVFTQLGWEDGRGMTGAEVVQWSKRREGKGSG